MKKRRVCYLGAGTWGFALASLIAENGHDVILWARDEKLKERLEKERCHPKMASLLCHKNLSFTSDIEEALEGADVIVESVTTSGIRPVFAGILKKRPIECPVIITSKGIEQKTGLFLPEVVSELIAASESPLVGILSGPSHAEEVMQKIPTAVVASAYTSGVMELIQELFTSPVFRVYPNSDIRGVSFGGAMKNVIAIACGIADGLGCGDNTKAALMTRGLHEMRKLSIVKGCRTETLNGLAGMGDLCVTCMSRLSRNYRFGRLIAEGLTPQEAKEKIGMAVEGVYSCVSARELAQKANIPVPITEAVYAIVYEGMEPKEAVLLMRRPIKEELL